MSGNGVTVGGQDELERDFRAAMGVLTEQTCAEGRELEVLEALFPLFVPGIGPDDGEDLGL